MAVLLADRLLPDVAQWADELTAIRHDLHSHPEYGFNTERTVGVICDHLRQWGVTDINTDFVKGAVIAVIEGNRPGHTIGVRADMDCLPMNDRCGKNVRMVPLNVHSAGTTFMASKRPALIEQMERTAVSIGLTLRETIVCKAVTIWAATGMGSTPK